MSDTDESNTKTLDDAVILSEVEHAENSLNVNKISDKKCDPLFKDTCTDNESDSVNEKKRRISDNENIDGETLHPNKKYKSCANPEQSAENLEINKESDVIPNATPSNIIEDTDSNKLEADLVNGSTPQEDKDCLSEEKNNEQKSQGNDKTKISKLDSDTTVNEENSETKNETVESVHAKVLKHIESTRAVVCCERMNFKKYIVKKASKTETNCSSSENEETAFNSQKVSVKKLNKEKLKRKTSVSSDSEDDNIKTKKKLSKKPKMKIENLHTEHMDSDDSKSDPFVTVNKSNSKISDQELIDMLNTDSNDDKTNKEDISSDNDSGINIAIKINESKSLQNGKKINSDSESNSEKEANTRTNIKMKGKKSTNSESNNSNSSASDNESESRTNIKKLPKKSSEKTSMDSEFDSNSESESHDKKIHKKLVKINEKKANAKSENDSESETNSKKNDSDSDSKQSDKENKKSSDSESEKDENSDKENYKSSSSESKSRTKKLSKKSTSNSNNDETDSDSENEVEDKSDNDDENTKSKKIDKLAKSDSNKSTKDPERGINRLKKFLRIAGIHVPNYGKLFENIKSIHGKEKKLRSLLEEHGLKGRPSIEKCKKIRKKIEFAKETAELDTSNIIAKDGRPKRETAFRQRQPRAPTPDPNYQRTFNRIRALVDSDSD